MDDDSFIRGGTDVIQSYLSSSVNVIYLVPSYKVSQWVFRNAMDHYGREPYNAKVIRTRQVIDFGPVLLKITHLDGSSNRLYETLQGFGGVMILHPETIFEHGRDEQIADLIHHRNKQHVSTQL